MNLLICLKRSLKTIFSNKIRCVVHLDQGLVVGGGTGGGYHLTFFVFFLVLLYFFVSHSQSRYLGSQNMMDAVSVSLLFLYYLCGLLEQKLWNRFCKFLSAGFIFNFNKCCRGQTYCKVKLDGRDLKLTANNSSLDTINFNFKIILKLT